jgi:aspartyl-tRNA(Asn)/glutamyl-tRNA(Gln) amidotransferase subunit A
MTGVEMARAVRAKDISPVELVQASLERAEAWQPVTNAFSQLHADEALEEARARGEAVARGHLIGPLHGVPVAVKDLFDVAGWETTGCSAAYRGRVAEHDAEAVRRLRAAGAVIVGKTNQHELGAGATNAVSACGPARNPWDPSRITGGSSGGSGAAVAARIVPIALGTDTGGSIRLPAALCGVGGLKPTHGRVSLSGVMPLAPSMDTAGPLAATVEDLATCFSVLTGEADRFMDQTTGPVAELTVASLGGFHTALVHPEVEVAVEQVGEVLEHAGVDVVVMVGDPPSGPDLWEEVAWPEFAEAHGTLLAHPDLLLPPTRSALEEGAGRTAGRREEANRARREVTGFFLRALAIADALLTPVTPFAAPPLHADLVDVGGPELSVRSGAVSRLTRLVSLAGLPAVAIPAGFSSDGLPIGAQLVGRPGTEAVLLRLAGAVQRATDHHRREPGLPRPGKETRD